MPNPVWPATLPAYVNQDSYSEQPFDNAVRTQFEGGNYKMRRRFTVTPVKVQAGLTLTGAQRTYLNDFFVTTCKGGTLAFDWVLPSSQAATVMVFTQSPKISAAGPDTFVAMLELQTVP